jgi:hypothetical protein
VPYHSRCGFVTNHRLSLHNNRSLTWPGRINSSRRARGSDHVYGDSLVERISVYLGWQDQNRECGCPPACWLGKRAVFEFMTDTIEWVGKCQDEGEEDNPLQYAHALDKKVERKLATQ